MLKKILIQIIDFIICIICYFTNKKNIEQSNNLIDKKKNPGYKNINTSSCQIYK